MDSLQTVTKGVENNNCLKYNCYGCSNWRLYLISKVQSNRVQNPSFGMNSSFKAVKRIDWAAEDLAKNNEKINNLSQGILAIFVNSSKNNVGCYTFKLSKYDSVNRFFERHPKFKLKMDIMFKKTPDYGYSDSCNQGHSTLAILKRSKERLQSMTQGVNLA